MSLLWLQKFPSKLQSKLKLVETKSNWIFFPSILKNMEFNYLSNAILISQIISEICK